MCIYTDIYTDAPVLTLGSVLLHVIMLQAMHADLSDVIVVQLNGTKTWEVCLPKGVPTSVLDRVRPDSRETNKKRAADMTTAQKAALHEIYIRGQYDLHGLATLRRMESMRKVPHPAFVPEYFTFCTFCTFSVLRVPDVVSLRRCILPYKCRKLLEMVFKLTKLCFNNVGQGIAPPPDPAPVASHPTPHTTTTSHPTPTPHRSNRSTV